MNFVGNIPVGKVHLMKADPFPTNSCGIDDLEQDNQTRRNTTPSASSSQLLASVTVEAPQAQNQH